MITPLKLALPAALGAGLLLAAPASASPWNGPHNLRAEIRQLDRQIDQMRGLSPREEVRLERRVDNLQALYRSFARGGFTRYELRTLDREIAATKVAIRAQAYDRNGHRGQRGGRY